MSIRFTTKRKRILQVLKESAQPLSAAKLHAKMPDLDLTTIYRTLDLFTKEKLITRVHLDSEEALYEYQAEPHHHAICHTCERVIHFTAPDRKLVALLNLTDFNVEEIELTVRGRCEHEKK